jgi:hypothetical protein
MIMKEFLMVILAGCLLLSLSSCLEDEVPKIDPCNDYEWAKVDLDGNEICFENASVFIFEPNTTHSYLHAQFYKAGDRSVPSISAFFKVPVSGLELETTYPAYDGDFFGAEDIVDGEVQLFSYKTNDDGGLCITGTFSLTTKNPTSEAITTFTNGKFVVSQGQNFSSCNPF